MDKNILVTKYNNHPNKYVVVSVDRNTTKPIVTLEWVTDNTCVCINISDVPYLQASIKADKENSQAPHYHFDYIRSDGSYTWGEEQFLFAIENMNYEYIFDKLKHISETFDWDRL